MTAWRTAGVDFEIARAPLLALRAAIKSISCTYKCDEALDCECY